jgi:hypothetical protein
VRPVPGIPGEITLRRLLPGEAEVAWLLALMLLTDARSVLVPEGRLLLLDHIASSCPGPAGRVTCPNRRPSPP